MSSRVFDNFLADFCQIFADARVLPGFEARFSSSSSCFSSSLRVFYLDSPASRLRQRGSVPLIATVADECVRRVVVFAPMALDPSGDARPVGKWESGKVGRPHPEVGRVDGVEMSGLFANRGVPDVT